MPIFIVHCQFKLQYLIDNGVNWLKTWMKNDSNEIINYAVNWIISFLHKLELFEVELLPNGEVGWVDWVGDE